ncbi:MAG TPA: hypothetical protein PK405_01305 [Hyphomicrobiales bacterium]|nr:hypothetical protein [Hyphomicrobiales bacterium]
MTNPPANWHGSGAVWLWDTGRRRLAWANGEALALWEAKDFAQAEARMDVAQQPGLANLARLSGTLPENGGRIERLRLFIGGSNANLTCQCAWHPCGRGRLLAVRVLDAGARRSGGRGGHRAADSAGGDLAAGMLAGLGEPALAIGKGGDLLYANPPGASLFFNVAPDGTHRHAIRGLDALARRAGETGRCEGRLRCGDMVVNVEAVEVRPADGGQGFVAVRGLGAAAAESAPARPDDGAPGARIEAAISSAAAAEQGEKSGEGRPHPELPLGPGTAAGRESAAGQPAREAPGPQEGSGDLAWQAAARRKRNSAPMTATLRMSFSRPTGMARARARGCGRAGSADATARSFPSGAADGRPSASIRWILMSMMRSVRWPRPWAPESRATRRMMAELRRNRTSRRRDRNSCLRSEMTRRMLAGAAKRRPGYRRR